MTYEAVAHRGYPQCYPENSLPGILASIDAGARFVELDVQLSADGIPMVIHDADLKRVCGIEGNVGEKTAHELSLISCHEAVRFNKTFEPCPLVTLSDLVEAVQESDAHLFVEIKQESLASFSRQYFLNRVAEAIEPIKNRCTVISFDYDILILAKEVFNIGWVLSAFDEASKKQASTLAPAVLIYDVKKLERDTQFWPGNWDWFLYDIVEPEEAQYWAEKGVKYIETWDVARLLNSAND